MIAVSPISAATAAKAAASASAALVPSSAKFGDNSLYNLIFNFF
jgi:hypothetical protein